MISATVAIMSRPSSTLLLAAQRGRRILTPAASFSSSSSSSSSVSSRKLILYSKPGCCLCDGLKEKLQAAFLLAGPDSLHDVDLLVRDITTNPEWERAYQYEIPVLAKVLPDGSEETLPRLSPRLGVELIQKKLAAALQ
ncbi:uncharacterized protein LOC111445753 [Cucurbita moschata]|uniref:Glutaredoxin-like protein n=1 Tax=Cucurbita moschata TaxID=3662 RepID=A0A6J1FN20_CUCMO|nr:uncharacterized protein LOC111445753 [Cucurbita moschata]XP_022939984.1 uncharacterized protein LOC111445753 [Cucurbita moschata]